MEKKDLKKIEDWLWEIPKSYRKEMRVPCRIYATEKMLDQILTDRSLEQVVNVATLPGIEKYSYVMPDCHEGYGFAIGGVAATNIEKGGVISPGGVGFDINCGVRLLTSLLEEKEIKPYLADLATQIQRDVPSGLGRGVKTKLPLVELDQVLNQGAIWAIKKGYGTEEDLEYLEEGGCLHVADARVVSDLAKRRGMDQVGTLGSGNHFLEVQKVERIFDEEVANVLGLFLGQITILIHTGSRGLGHQIATDYIRLMLSVMMSKYQIILPDRELACAPFNSEEGQKYFFAMACGANFAWANRQMIVHQVRLAFEKILKPRKLDYSLKTIYDVAHNIAKVEEHGGKKYCVHRKGATRAFGPGHNQIPEKYKSIGQPVLIPGTMGTASYILVGTKKAMKDSFGSTCHGAGRRMSRSKAKQQVFGADLRRQLEARGIIIRCQSNVGLAEEAPLAYKDVDEVVDVVHAAGLSKKVARLVPLAVIKG